MSAKKTYVVIGTGGRAVGSFIKPLLDEFPEEAEMVGFFDLNAERAKAANDIAGTNVPIFTDFQAMIDETKPDRAIVCTKDSAHAEYIVKCLDQGIAVYSEKPVCTTFEQVQDIRRSANESSASAYVTHNMRFGANIEHMKKLLNEGVIGKVLHINFVELLDRFHGADYFRRWHRKMENSGGLMIHKSSHHFDVINWLADSLPKTVTAQGRLAFYGKNGEFRGSRCTDCQHTEKCEFYADVFKADNTRKLYKEVEGVDGYHRDGCVFDEEIDIPDTVNANITFENGVEANYSLIAYGSYEGMDILIEGTKGRLELRSVHGTQWAVGRDGDKENLANDGTTDEDRNGLKLMWPYKATENVTQPVPEGGHGGADPKLRKLLFQADLPDPLNQRAPFEEGIQAVLVGLAVNKSIEEGSQAIDVQSMEPSHAVIN